MVKKPIILNPSGLMGQKKSSDFIDGIVSESHHAERQSFTINTTSNEITFTVGNPFANHFLPGAGVPNYVPINISAGELPFPLKESNIYLLLDLNVVDGSYPPNSYGFISLGDDSHSIIDIKSAGFGSFIATAFTAFTAGTPMTDVITIDSNTGFVTFDIATWTANGNYLNLGPFTAAVLTLGRAGLPTATGTTISEDVQTYVIKQVEADTNSNPPRYQIFETLSSTTPIDFTSTGTGELFAIYRDTDAPISKLRTEIALIPGATPIPQDFDFGDGTPSGNQNIVLTVASGPSYSLVSPTYWNDLTIDSGVTLYTNGWPIYVKGTLTNNGTIDASGTDGTTTTSGVSPDSNELGSGTHGSIGPSYTIVNSMGGASGGAGGAIESTKEELTIGGALSLFDNTVGQTVTVTNPSGNTFRYQASSPAWVWANDLLNAKVTITPAVSSGLFNANNRLTDAPITNYDKVAGWFEVSNAIGVVETVPYSGAGSDSISIATDSFLAVTNPSGNTFRYHVPYGVTNIIGDSFIIGDILNTHGIANLSNGNKVVTAITDMGSLHGVGSDYYWFEITIPSGGVVETVSLGAYEALYAYRVGSNIAGNNVAPAFFRSALRYPVRSGANNDRVNGGVGGVAGAVPSTGIQFGITQSGGGAGAGVIAIYARHITGTGNIFAKGGKGGNGANATVAFAAGCAGASGGGGGFIILVYIDMAGQTVSVVGGVRGEGGAGLNSAPSGLPGSAGDNGTILKYNLTTRSYE